MEHWLTTAQPEHGGLWVYIDPSTTYHDASIIEHFDVIIYVDRITPTRPTANALDSAARRVRF